MKHFIKEWGPFILFVLLLAVLRILSLNLSELMDILWTRHLLTVNA